MSPEPETDAFSEAVNVMARAAFLNRTAEGGPDYAAGLRALLEPRITTCETCWGTGTVDLPSPTRREGKHMVTLTIAVTGPCHAEGCVDGQVTRPSLAVLRGDLERAEYAIVLDENGRKVSRKTADLPHIAPLYRIASGGTDSE